MCIDIQAGVAQRAGVGRYTQSLVRALAPLAGADELRLFYFDFRRQGEPLSVPGARLHPVRWCPGRLAQLAWKHLNWPPFDALAGPADVYHFPNFIIPPLRRGRTVVTIHDMSFERFPDMAEERNLRYLRSRIHRTAARADVILTDSQFSAREIVELLRVPRERVVAVPLGVAEHFRPASDEEIAAWRTHSGLRRPYLLLVSTLEPRKNIPLLVEVFERLEDFDGELVLAGALGWKTDAILQRIRHSPRVERIRLLNYVEDRWLPALYSAASAFVFPSFYEGFGLPPLEAMACGTPVVCAPAGSLPEILGDAPLWVSGYDPDAWTESVRRVLREESLRAELRERGRRQAARFRWEETARQTWSVYRSLA